jgi:hypothetical protein
MNRGQEVLAVGSEVIENIARLGNQNQQVIRYVEIREKWETYTCSVLLCSNML